MSQLIEVVEKGKANELFIESFLKDCSLRGMTPETVYNYSSMLKVFNKFLQGASVCEVKKEDMVDFMRYLKEERKVSLKRVENYFCAISSFYEYLVFEEEADKNPVSIIQKRYLRRYKREDPPQIRKLISVEEMSMLINSTLSIREKAIITLLAKTGIRKGELIRIDLEDIDWKSQSIALKPRAKRSNRIVFFDNECGRTLKKWISLRSKLKPNTNALFVSEYGNRADKNVIYYAVAKNAERVGLHNPKSPRVEDHFFPHCCRHWFTTHLLRSGMPREYVKELRGDARNEAIDIYHHIDKEELRKSYLACIPQLGIA